MTLIEGKADLAKRIRWNLMQMKNDGVLREVAYAQNRDTESEIRVIADDGNAYSIVVTKLTEEADNG